MRIYYGVLIMSCVDRLIMSFEFGSQNIWTWTYGHLGRQTYVRTDEYSKRNCGLFRGQTVNRPTLNI